MKILTFEFQSARRGWTLEPMALDAFNLLVGVSGAGKSQAIPRRSIRAHQDALWSRAS
ncbi:hypothetical protein [Sorangium cellulosum]|uniref:hypothetical protein n=1 Tax=Sorangium cellulosum TaxID=56 RepID=UPI00040F2364|nr:hypothetical protein [Sorangium cellulosum]